MRSGTGVVWLSDPIAVNHQELVLEPFSPPRSGRLQPACGGPPKGGHYMLVKTVLERVHQVWPPTMAALDAAYARHRVGTIMISCIHGQTIDDPWCAG